MLNQLADFINLRFEAPKANTHSKMLNDDIQHVCVLQPGPCMAGVLPVGSLGGRLVFH